MEGSLSGRSSEENLFGSRMSGGVVREVGLQGIERWKYGYGGGMSCWQWV